MPTSSTSLKTSAPRGRSWLGPVLGLACACVAAGVAAGATAAAPSVLGLDLTGLDADGLQGQGSSRRALDYEYCIPAGKGPRTEVAALDPTARFMPGSRGRIGCGPDQVLVLGNTHQPGFEQVLQRLAALPYVARIQQAWFE